MTTKKLRNSSRCVTKRLRRTAIHEAGHGVVALALGVRFNHVTIVADETHNSLGHVRLLPRRERSFSPLGNHNPRNLLNRMTVAYAGAVAEKAAGHRPRRETWEPDRMAAWDFADSLSGRLGLSQEWINLGYKRAQAFERMLHDDIHALADALLERQTLSEQECRDVVQGRAGGRVRREA